MKRNCIVLALLCCLFTASSTATASPFPQVVRMEETDLPASVVQAVLTAVDNRTEYTYSQLSSWYQIGRVVIDQVGENDYKVTIIDEDGGTEIILLDNL